MAEHKIDKPTYYRIFGALMILLILTALADLVDLGPFNVVVALVIAAAKAVLIVLFFMHIRYSSRLTWLFAIAGLFWLSILLVLTLSDFVTRGWLPVPGW